MAVIGLVGGAVIGGVVGGGTHVIGAVQQGENPSDVFKEAVIGTVSGAVSGGVGGLLLGSGVGFVEGAAVGAVAGGSGKLVENSLENLPHDPHQTQSLWTRVFEAMAAGGVSGLILPSLVPRGAYGIESVSAFFTGSQGAVAPVGVRFAVDSLAELAVQSALESALTPGVALAAISSRPTFESTSK
ncbi:MAG TPA: hypothetical protein VKT99_04235 [Xanthobacteraceae bacterium]|nr:hypothetical protein [Xanthobacteraceae bacterium]